MKGLTITFAIITIACLITAWVTKGETSNTFLYLGLIFSGVSFLCLNEWGNQLKNKDDDDDDDDLYYSMT